MYQSTAQTTDIREGVLLMAISKHSHMYAFSHTRVCSAYKGSESDHYVMVVAISILVLVVTVIFVR